MMAKHLFAIQRGPNMQHSDILLEISFSKTPPIFTFIATLVFFIIVLIKWCCFDLITVSVTQIHGK